MKYRLLSTAALALALAAGACRDDSTTSPNNAPDNATPPPSFAKQTSALLTNVPVTGTFADLSAFTGTLTVTRFSVDRQTGELLVSGVLKDASGTVVARFTDVGATLSEGATIAQVTGSCSILDLDIGAIHLDLLGLVVDLAPIHLDITAQTGSNRLLGNLLCALTGLLDDFPDTLQQILNILNQINALLR
jgi:hypothetical protein